MNATILDLRRRMPEVLQALDRNEQVTISYRGQERAVLLPTSQQQKRQSTPINASDHAAFGMWADTDQTDVAETVRRMRQPRYHDL